MCQRCLSRAEARYSNFAITSYKNGPVKVLVGKTTQQSENSKQLELISETLVFTNFVLGYCELDKNGALDLSLPFEELAERLGVTSSKRIARPIFEGVITDALGSEVLLDDDGNNLNLVMDIQDNRVIETIIKKAAEATASSNEVILMLRRLLKEQDNSFAQEILLSCLKPLVQHQVTDVRSSLKSLSYQIALLSI